jgi:hypothetical protein
MIIGPLLLIEDTSKVPKNVIDYGNFDIHWKPLNVITLVQIETDNIN